MPDELTRDTFAPNAGTTFSVHVGDRTVELILAEVSAPRSSPRAEAFSLIFHGPLDLALAQQEYSFEHAVIGEFSLFIVPVSRDADTLHYEAVFNRLRPQP